MLATINQLTHRCHKQWTHNNCWHSVNCECSKWIFVNLSGENVSVLKFIHALYIWNCHLCNNMQCTYNEVFIEHFRLCPIRFVCECVSISHVCHLHRTSALFCVTPSIWLSHGRYTCCTYISIAACMHVMFVHLVQRVHSN